jgi:nicotinamidase-related amidase
MSSAPTSTPRTLAGIAGISQIPARPEDCVLLLIDAQREYTTGKLPLTGMEAAIGEGARLLAFARQHGMPVFHAIHHGRPGGPLFDPRGDGVQFIDALAPCAGEIVLTKSLPNAFTGTGLAARIRDTGRREIVIAGFATHMCVSATARSALDHGLRNTVVAAATATRELPHSSGAGVLPAEWLQQATLAALADRFSVVVQDTASLVQRAAHPG